MTDMSCLWLAGLITSVWVYALLLSSAAAANAKDSPGPPPQEEISRLPADGGEGFNRLIHEKSPYLLQHARNPVDWYPWGDEALARAKREDKPVFLSIGYSTCHWCHVMERASFEDRGVAKIMNRHYIAIKVDREERPDLDEVYMTATQLLTGRGGWPNSVWLTPDGRPWHAGTYFPKDDYFGRPGFTTMLSQLADVWETRRREVEAQAHRLAAALRQALAKEDIGTEDKLDRSVVDSAVEALIELFDEQNGGLVGAPKFPPHTSLSLLIYDYRKRGDPSVLRIIAATLDAMARGGIHDHIGGGFHRYSTDARWFLPHFEKMLYDNAQLARTYVDGYLITGNEEYLRAARGTYDWVLRVMTDEKGGFYSAVDADSEGTEGKFYVWSRDEIIEALGEEEGGIFCRAYGVEEGGNFRDETTGETAGTNVLYLKVPVGELAGSEGMPLSNLEARLARGRETLLGLRNNRVRPHLDDKVITAWTGLMIGSLAYGGRLLNEPRYVSAAEKAAEFVLANLYEDGKLLRTYRGGESRLNGYLEDYAFLADGLLDLYEADEDERHVATVKELVQTLLLHFRDRSAGGFFFTSDDHDRLLMRIKDPFDKAIPSGNGVAARAMVRLARLTGDRKYLVEAEATLDAFLGFIRKAPRGAESLIHAAGMLLDEAPIEKQRTSAQEPSPASVVSEPDVHIRKKPVTVDAFASHLVVAPGESLHVAIKVRIDDGWHVNSNTPHQDYLIPTSVSLEDSPAMSLREARYPSGTDTDSKFAFSNAALSVYHGTIWIVVQLTLDRKVREGPLKTTLQLRAQACDDSSCLRPQVLILPLVFQVDKRAAEGRRHSAVFQTLGLP